MTRVFRPRLEILPGAQRRLWPQLQPSVKLGMVLYGGTAIALRLGHRASVDFDFFTDKPLCKGALQAALPFIAGAAVLQDQPDTFTVVVSEGEAQAEHVKLSFFGGIGFGRVGEPEATEDGVVRVASLADLMATKSKVILQRVEARDYQDIAAMIRAGVSLSTGLAAARALYGLAFQPSESLKALMYFEGGDLNILSTEDKETLIDAASGVRDLPNVHIAARSLG
ncbi:MAG: nucleotidyl transferase AbiEii/AbiGii toxin family protein [Gammaproteobacteria bacterium]